MSVLLCGYQFQKIPIAAELSLSRMMKPCLFGDIPDCCCTPNCLQWICSCSLQKCPSWASVFYGKVQNMLTNSSAAVHAWANPAKIYICHSHILSWMDIGRVFLTVLVCVWWGTVALTSWRVLKRTRSWILWGGMCSSRFDLKGQFARWVSFPACQKNQGISSW